MIFSEVEKSGSKAVAFYVVATKYVCLIVECAVRTERSGEATERQRDRQTDRRETSCRYYIYKYYGGGGKLYAP